MASEFHKNCKMSLLHACNNCDRSGEVLIDLGQAPKSARPLARHVDGSTFNQLACQVTRLCLDKA